LLLSIHLDAEGPSALRGKRGNRVLASMLAPKPHPALSKKISWGSGLTKQQVQLEMEKQRELLVSDKSDTEQNTVQQPPANHGDDLPVAKGGEESKENEDGGPKPCPKPVDKNKSESPNEKGGESGSGEEDGEEKHEHKHHHKHHREEERPRPDKIKSLKHKDESSSAGEAGEILSTTESSHKEDKQAKKERKKKEKEEKLLKKRERKEQKEREKREKLGRKSRSKDSIDLVGLGEHKDKLKYGGKRKNSADALLRAADKITDEHDEQNNTTLIIKKKPKKPGHVDGEEDHKHHKKVQSPTVPASTPPPTRRTSPRNDLIAPLETSNLPARNSQDSPRG